MAFQKVFGEGIDLGAGTLKTQLAAASGASGDLLLVMTSAGVLKKVTEGSGAGKVVMQSGGTIGLDGSGVTASSYGSATAIPVLTIDASGVITAASTAAIQTSFTAAADSGSSQTIEGGDTLTIAGGAGIATAASATDTITVSLNVDDSTVEINSDTLRLKDSGVATAKIADAAVTADKLASAVAGDGLAGGAGTALSVTVDDSTIEINSDSLRLKNDGVTGAKLHPDVAGNALGQDASGNLDVQVDDSSIEVNSDSLRVKASGVTNAMLAGSIANDKLLAISAANKVEASALELSSNSALQDSSGLNLKSNIAGDGLAIDESSGNQILSVGVDGSSIEINSDALRVKAGGITSAMIADSTIVDGDISGSAAIAHNKMDALSASKLLVSDANGVVSASSVTSTEAGYLSGVSSAIQTQLDSMLELDGSDAMTGALDMGSNKITNVTDPTAAQDGATKAYVDAQVSGMDLKESVKVATTANITLSGTQTIDGVSLSAGDRVLVKDQSTASENGVYVVAASSWARAEDFNQSSEFVGAPFFMVDSGSVNGAHGFVSTHTSAPSIGSDSITFYQFSAPGQDSVAGAGLAKSGNVLSVGVDDSGIEINNDALRLKDSGVATAKIANAAVDEDKLASSVAGDGLAGGAGTALSVNVDDTGIEINSDSLRLKDSGVVTAKIANAAVDEDKLASSVAGNGLAGGAGTALSLDIGELSALQSGQLTTADSLAFDDDSASDSKRITMTEYIRHLVKYDGGSAHSTSPSGFKPDPDDGSRIAFSPSDFTSASVAVASDEFVLMDVEATTSFGTNLSNQSAGRHYRWVKLATDSPNNAFAVGNYVAANYSSSVQFQDASAAKIVAIYTGESGKTMLVLDEESGRSWMGDYGSFAQNGNYVVVYDASGGTPSSTDTPDYSEASSSNNEGGYSSSGDVHYESLFKIPFSSSTTITASSHALRHMSSNSQKGKILLLDDSSVKSIATGGSAASGWTLLSSEFGSNDAVIYVDTGVTQSSGHIFDDSDNSTYGDSELTSSSEFFIGTYTSTPAIHARKESFADLATAQAGDGLAASQGVFSVRVDGTGIEINSDVLRLKDDGVLGAKLHPDVAGSGLTQDASGNLDVDLNALSAAAAVLADDSFVMIDASDNSTKKESLADLVALLPGDGLGQNGTSKQLEVNVDDTGIEISSDTLQLKDSGVATAKIANLAVTTTKIAAEAVTEAQLADSAKPFEIAFRVEYDAQGTCSAAAVSDDAYPEYLEFGISGNSPTANEYTQSTATLQDLFRIKLNHADTCGTDFDQSSFMCQVFIDDADVGSQMEDELGGASLKRVKDSAGDIYAYLDLDNGHVGSAAARYIRVAIMPVKKARLG